MSFIAPLTASTMSFVIINNTFSLVCWYGSIHLKNRNRLQGIVKVCSKVTGITLNNLSDLYKVRTLKKKACSILVDPSHPLSKDFCLAADIFCQDAGHKN